MMTQPIITGSISSGTLRTSDLLQAFSDALTEIDMARYREIRDEYADFYLAMDSCEGFMFGTEFEDYLLDNDDLNDTASYLVNEVLFDALNDAAPEGYYFGALEGDGADFGFWPLDTEE